jgi:hypothetical protein
VRRALILTLCVLGIAVAGCGGSSGKKAPPADSYLSKAAPGYRYVPLSAADEQQVRAQFGKGLEVTDQLIVRRVLKGDKVAAAAMVVRLKSGQSPDDVISGFEEKSAATPTDIKIGGKEAKLIKSSNLYAVYDTDVQTFLAVFAQTAAEAEAVAVPIVR